VKDYMTMNFSRKRLYSIWKSGEDAGRYGRPKQPMNPLLILVLLVAGLLLIVGLLILSGKLDLGGWFTSIGLSFGGTTR
jgi:hypothetical protein